MQTEIFEYVKTKRGRVGVLLGTMKDDVIRIGWSRCNTKRCDVFDPKEGIKLAKHRATNDFNTYPIPQSLNKQARKFSSRCLRYFQNAKGIRLPEKDARKVYHYDCNDGIIRTAVEPKAPKLPA